MPSPRDLFVSYVLPAANFIRAFNKKLFKYIVCPLAALLAIILVSAIIFRSQWQQKLLTDFESTQKNPPLRHLANSPSNAVIQRRILHVTNQTLFSSESNFKQRALLQYGTRLSESSSLIFVLHENGVPFHGAFLFRDPRYRDLIMNGSAALVYWDQPGYGMNHANRRDTLDEMVLDLKTVIESVVQQVDYLKSLESPRKSENTETEVSLPVFLMGFGSGNLLGMNFIQKHPELIHKYFSVSGYIGNWIETDVAIWKKHHDTSYDEHLVLQPLMRMGPPPYLEDANEHTAQEIQYEFQKHMNLRSIALRNGGTTASNHRGESALSFYVKRSFVDLISSPDYSLQEVWHSLWIKRSFWWMWNDWRTQNLHKQVTEIEVPICFLHGRYDWYGSPISFVKDYYNTLEAPEKSFYQFDKSGHLLFVEEQTKFQRTILTEIHKSI